MLITTVNGPPSGVDAANSKRGLGQFSPWGGKSVYTEGTDFKCTSAICYGLKDVHNFFQQLQGEINRFAPLAGFAPLKVDGFIGAGTVKAAQAAAKYIVKIEPDFGAQSAHPTILKGLVDGSLGTKQALAINALAVYGVLGGFAAGKFPEAPPPPPEAPKAVTPTAPVVVRQPSAAPEAFTPSPEPAAAATTQPTTKKPSTVIWWVAGGVAAAALVGIVGYAVYRGKKRQGLRTEPTRSFKRRPRGEFAPGF
jgi:hypothetical protein